MKTIEITVDNAVKAYELGTEKQKEFLKNLLGEDVFVKDIRDRIKNMDDVYRLNGTTEEEFNKKWDGFASHEIGNAKEILIAAAYNEGKLPDFSNPNQKKCTLVFSMGSPSGGGFSYLDYGHWGTASRIGSRLVFLSYDNDMDAAKKFLPEYKQSRTT